MSQLYSVAVSICDTVTEATPSCLGDCLLHRGSAELQVDTYSMGFMAWLITVASC